jgi:hypothetical protein
VFDIDGLLLLWGSQELIGSSEQYTKFQGRELWAMNIDHEFGLLALGISLLVPSLSSVQCVS